MTKCGFIAVIGSPNVGKSTLINALVGSKVTIVSHKVQTTRNRILGIALEGETQLILVDTPGIFEDPKRRLEKAMVKSAWDSLGDADGVMVLVDVSHKNFMDTDRILSYLQKYQKKVVVVLNKIDLIQREELLSIAQHFSRSEIDQVFMISALKKDGIQDIKNYWAKNLPEGPWLFPEDQLSDLPQRLLAAEITREELFHRLHEELPYSLWVETDSWEEFKNGSVKIIQSIYVQRESQRSIVLGKGGGQIKAIGEASRKQLTYILERPVHLFLHVKVKAGWIDNPQLYASIGLNFKV
ncbi:GTPase Era [Kamptonema cortianum]|jgi:GTP-binding protein Era|nr:GTPase Era [Geitlerinema splendidum]MDK3160003.1 GTPase Era [Kamptonema cortianum]